MKFAVNPSFLREARRDPRFDAEMGDRASDIEARAAALTSRGSDKRRGHFAGRFTTEWVDGIPRVGNTDQSFIHLLETGSVNNPAQAPLRRAVKAAGLRLDVDPKSK